MRGPLPGTRPGGTRPIRPRRLVAVAVAAGLLAVAGCGGSSDDGKTADGKTEITFANWADAEPNTKPGIRALIKKFESLHPDIKIKSQPVDFTSIEHQLVLQTQSGNPPDVAEMAGNYTFSLEATGALEPLDGYAQGAYAQSVIPRELSLGKIKGKLMAVPWTVAPFALWYNKKVMKQAGLDPKPPATWDELIADAKRIQQRKPKNIAFGMDSTNREYGLDQDWPIMKSFGAEPFRGSKATADSPGMRDFLQFVRTTAKEKLTPSGKKAGEFRQPAASDQVAFTVDGPYVKGVVQATNHMTDKEFYDTWGVAPLPAGPAGKHYSAPTDHQLVMFNKAGDKKAAWEFMKFLSTSDYAVSHYTLKYENSIPPLAKPTGAVAKALDNPIAKAFRDEVVPTVIRPGWGKQYGAAYANVMSNVQRAMTSSGSIDAIAKAMQSAVSSDVAQ